MKFGWRLWQFSSRSEAALNTRLSAKLLYAFMAVSTLVIIKSKSTLKIALRPAPSHSQPRFNCLKADKFAISLMCLSALIFNKWWGYMRTKERSRFKRNAFTVCYQAVFDLHNSCVFTFLGPCKNLMGRRITSRWWLRNPAFGDTCQSPAASSFSASQLSDLLFLSLTVSKSDKIPISDLISTVWLCKEVNFFL